MKVFGKDGLAAVGASLLLAMALVGCSAETTPQEQPSDQPAAQPAQESTPAPEPEPEDIWVMTCERRYESFTWGNNPADVTEERHEYDIDEQGNVIAARDYYNERLSAEHAYTYDASGNAVQHVYTDYNSEGDVEEIYTFDYSDFDSHGEWGTMTTTVEDEGGTSVTTKTREVEYDTWGNIVRDTKYFVGSSHDGEIDEERTWEYDAKGNLLYRGGSASDDEFGYDAAYSYERDDKGRVVSMTVYDYGTGEEASTDFYIEEHDGYYVSTGEWMMIVADDGRTLYEENWYDGRITGYAYDDKGNVIESAVWGRDGVLESVETRVYDRHGLLLSTAMGYADGTKRELVSYEYTNPRTGEFLRGQDISTLRPLSYPEHVLPYQQFLYGDGAEVSQESQEPADVSVRTIADIVGHWESQGGDLPSWTFDFYDDGTFHADVPEPGEDFDGTWDYVGNLNASLYSSEADSSLSLNLDPETGIVEIVVVSPEEAHGLRATFAYMGGGTGPVTTGNSGGSPARSWVESGSIYVSEGPLAGFEIEFHTDERAELGNGSFVTYYNNTLAFSGYFEYDGDDVIIHSMEGEGGHEFRITPVDDGSFEIVGIWPPQYEGTVSFGHQ